MTEEISQVVGERVRRRRHELRLSLRALAARIGMTAGYLSRVENQRLTPSLDSLQAIATALDTPMFYFLQPLSTEPVVRAHQRRKLFFPDAPISYELLSPEADLGMMAVLICLAEGGERIARPLARSNTQWMFVLSGAMSITTADDKYVLNEGDSICFDGNTLQCFSSVGSSPLRVICVVIPPIL